MAISAKKLKAIEKRIVPVGEATPYLRALVYARNGKGKTRFAASAPKCFIVDINEEGTQSVDASSDAEVLPAKTWEDVVYAYWYLRQSDHGYESVSIDTLTMMQRVCMKHVLKEAEDRDPTREPSMPDQRTWGKVGNLMGEYMLNFRNLPMNVIFTAQERTIGNEEEGEEIMTVPNLSPASRDVALGCVSLVGRMYMKEVRSVNKKTKKEGKPKWQTRMLIGPHEDFETKNRVNALHGKKILVEPTVPKILEAMAQNPGVNDGEED